MSRRPVWGRRVPPAVWVSVVGALALVGVAAAVGLLARPVSDSASLLRPELPAGSYPTSPIPAGQVVPAVQAEGWVNTPPPAVGTDRKLVVLDIWSSW
jgi:hypothetical protein